jgi:cytoskeletal protein CcmA (bactofilin family)
MNDTTTKGDIKIAGAGTVATGTYRLVSVSGTATITGDVECETLKVSGSADGRGSLKADKVTVSGTIAYSGGVEAQDMRVSGSANIGESLKGGMLNVSGSARVGGDLVGETVQIHGALTVDGDCEAERFSGEGGFTIGGLLNAGAIDVTLWGPCRVREIGGEAISVRFGRGSFRRLVAMFVPEWDTRLTCESIEGDDVRLEHTTARTVRGGSVVLGPNCDIGLVEYTGSYSAAPDAKVKEARKVEAGGSRRPQETNED